MSGARGRRLIPVNVHGAKISGAPRAVKDLDYDELDYYQEGRNEPVPPDANIVSAVKLKKKTVLVNSAINKTEEERKLTEMRVEASLSKMKRKNRSIPIPACDPLVTSFSGASETQDFQPELQHENVIELEETRIVVLTELGIFMDEFKGEAVSQLPTVKVTVAVNDQHFAIKTQDPLLKSELRKLKSEMKEFYSDPQNATLQMQNLAQLQLGGFYVYRALIKHGKGLNESYLRVQITALADNKNVRVFLCDDGFEMDIDSPNDLLPLLEKWADLPQLACWAQIAPGSLYLKDGIDKYFESLYKEQTVKVLSIGTEPVFKYSDSLCPAKVVCSRLHIIKTADDYQRYIRQV